MAIKKITLPDLGEGVTEGEIIKIKVREGDSVAMDQTLVEVMTDKASMEIPSSIEGAVKKVEVREGDIVPIGASLFTVQTQTNQPEAESKQKPEKKEQAQAAAKESSDPMEKDQKKAKDSANFALQNLAIPSTRQLARDLGLSLKDIRGTGNKGEIKREDLLNHIKSRLGFTRPQADPALLSDSPAQSFKEEKREKLRGIKRLMFESMTLSKATIPHFTIGEQAQVEYLVKVRAEMKPRLEKKGLKLGYLPFFIKALLPVLKEFPVFNSFYSEKTKELIFKKDLHIGFAVDSRQGLMVPVLKSAQEKSLLEIIEETAELAEQARQGSISRKNLMGAGITLSNLGGLGGIYGTPIINPPEMAIMGIYKLFKQAVKNRQGDFEEKPFMNFSITCDHRFIDGATASRFLKSFICKIEEPSLLLLD